MLGLCAAPSPTSASHLWPLEEEVEALQGARPVQPTLLQDSAGTLTVGSVEEHQVISSLGNAALITSRIIIVPYVNLFIVCLHHETARAKLALFPAKSRGPRTMPGPELVLSKYMWSD